MLSNQKNRKAVLCEIGSLKDNKLMFCLSKGQRQKQLEFQRGKDFGSCHIFLL
jgi:hypothetical protein